MNVLWDDPIYQETVSIVIGSVFLIGLLIFWNRQKNTHMMAGWASVKSWLFLTPLLLLLIGSPTKWVLIGLTIVAITAVKSFFKITGMYHRSYFVYSCYFGIIALPFLITYKLDTLYNISPMIMLGTICLIPLLRNSYKRMIQYISLTLLVYSFLGWGFMHLGKLIYLPKGHYLLIYIIVLTEVCDILNLGISRVLGKKFAPFNNITPRRSLQGFLLSTVFTFTLAWGLRHLMPIREEPFWLAAGFSASIAGGFGDITMSVIRRDLGIKDVGVFILGRGDMMSRVDRLIFVAPIFYYSITHLLDKS